jgi:outer membrane receptor protein involved in Fe transport
MKRVLPLLLLLSSVAAAQEIALPDPIVSPTKKEGDDQTPADSDREIDLANVVTSAAKGVTTVQEAPAIVNIITSDEIKARGFREINQALQTLPGWMDGGAVGNQVSVPFVRGVFQGALLLQDGVSMFDPYANIAAFNRTQQIETIKRLEVVTGPGGVLWGANSFLGIVNVIMKDAEDVNGFEVAAGYGDGAGNRQNFRAYAMFGKAFWRNRIKIFQHVSYETWVGSTISQPAFFASSPAPQPPGPSFYGPIVEPIPTRSWLVSVDGKYSIGPISLTYRVPVGNMYPQMVFANALVSNSVANIYDRFAALEYKDRFWKDRLGLTVKVYYTQFVRNFSAQVFPTSSLLPPFTNADGSTNIGGLHFDFQRQLIQRAGGTLDMDLNLPKGFRVLFGGESFWESLTNSDVYFQSQSGTGGSSPAALPIVCPVAQTAGVYDYIPSCPRPFLFDSSRVVAALYANLQWRPLQKLTLDGGARLQKGFGQQPYDWTWLGSAAVVWNFAPAWHFKANYTTGFRPPVFNNTAAVQGGVSFGSNPNLKNETSQSFQGEINARLLRNVKKIRELEIRIDYAYTFLDRLIILSGGTYQNAGQRAIHSAEAFAKLYLAGDHFLQASYTYLYTTISDSGIYRGVPHNVFQIGGSFNIVKNLFDVNANLLVTSAFQDPNRVPTQPSSPITPTDVGGVMSPGGTTTARASDVAWDRLTPIALLQLGFRLRFLKERLGVSGQFYNVLNQRYYMADAFYDLTPSTEMTPSPAPGFSFFGNISWRQ